MFHRDTAAAQDVLFGFISSGPLTLPPLTFYGCIKDTPGHHQQGSGKKWALTNGQTFQSHSSSKKPEHLKEEAHIKNPEVNIQAG